MAQIGYCKRGGQEGITFDYDEALELSNNLGSIWIDEYIPLPRINVQTQVLERIKDISHKDNCGEDVKYYEREDGSHGWACTYCGKVHQWG